MLQLVRGGTEQKTIATLCHLLSLKYPGDRVDTVEVHKVYFQTSYVHVLLSQRDSSEGSLADYSGDCLGDFLGDSQRDSMGDSVGDYLPDCS